MPIPFLPGLWPYHRPLVPPPSPYMSVPTVAVYQMGGSTYRKLMVPFGNEGSFVPHDEQPEEESPWWNIVLAEDE